VIELGAKIALGAISAGKHVVLDNAELDATVGPILKVKADEAGVVITGIDGDEPAVAMNMIRLVRTMGLTPVLTGNIKGFMNRYRNPETQQGFAQQHGQDAAKVASFADGTKLAAEITMLSNASGFRVSQRGMEGPELSDVKEVLDHWTDAEALLARPTVDFILGAAPGSGVFVVAYEDDRERRAAMNYLKMGPGPLHLFTRPFHLPHLEGPLSAARAVLFGDAAVTPSGAPITDVAAVAKRDLVVGETLDGIGGFCCYGVVDDASTVVANGELPMGLTPGAVVKRPVSIDTPLTYDDVELPEGSLAVELRQEQTKHFGL
jgi:predicted homoserine dehydrogenase-like protein